MSRIECCITKATKTHTHTHRICHTYSFPTATVVARTRLGVTVRYITSLVFIQKEEIAIKYFGYEFTIQ